MVEIRFTKHTSAAPERVIAAATDFTEHRPEWWPNLDPAAFRPISVGETRAEAIEGSAVLGGIWAHERYDWSRPGLVRAEVTDSNVFAVGSSWELRVEAMPDGGSKVEWVSIRHPRGLKGAVLVTMLAVAGRRLLEPTLAETLRRLESSARP
ncbi:SRPBCC family protein [Micromonospora sp. CPCC 205371]|nr:SRPBCC family protein [Micromonospora sp. CPCC 205371]